MIFLPQKEFLILFLYCYVSLKSIFITLRKTISEQKIFEKHSLIILSNKYKKCEISRRLCDADIWPLA
ncbi:hypothetical protein BpHYR1_041411 [Brachionus plicatilis]|uniref:Uncharacterized protein n=1 Tax=Brachionus plicatilis TaxID=10195 RepID=A0A3M7QLN0_BRAPC|nr:hypothetical protein BpHYR1_041411 [Brachionus plicatilis]